VVSAPSFDKFQHNLSNPISENHSLGNAKNYHLAPYKASVKMEIGLLACLLYIMIFASTLSDIKIIFDEK